MQEADKCFKFLQSQRKQIRDCSLILYMKFLYSNNLFRLASKFEICVTSKLILSLSLSTATTVALCPKCSLSLSQANTYKKACFLASLNKKVGPVLHYNLPIRTVFTKVIESPQHSQLEIFLSYYAVPLATSLHPVWLLR